MEHNDGGVEDHFIDAVVGSMLIFQGMKYVKILAM